MSNLDWQPIYSQCGQCQQPARLDVDLTAHPHIGGKIGVRCTRCGRTSVYNFYTTPEAEIARQAQHKLKIEATGGNEGGAIEWQPFHCAMLGLLPQPKEGDEGPWQPDGRTLTWWKSLRLGGRGPLDRLDPQEEHGTDDDDRGRAAGADGRAGAGFGAGGGGYQRPGCEGD